MYHMGEPGEVTGLGKVLTLLEAAARAASRTQGTLVNIFILRVVFVKAKIVVCAFSVESPEGWGREEEGLAISIR